MTNWWCLWEPIHLSASRQTVSLGYHPCHIANTLTFRKTQVGPWPGSTVCRFLGTERLCFGPEWQCSFLPLDQEFPWSKPTIAYMESLDRCHGASHLLAPCSQGAERWRWLPSTHKMDQSGCYCMASKWGYPEMAVPLNHKKLTRSHSVLEVDNSMHHTPKCLGEDPKSRTSSDHYCPLLVIWGVDKFIPLFFGFRY